MPPYWSERVPVSCPIAYSLKTYLKIIRNIVNLPNLTNINSVVRKLVQKNIISHEVIIILDINGEQAWSNLDLIPSFAISHIAVYKIVEKDFRGTNIFYFLFLLS